MVRWAIFCLQFYLEWFENMPGEVFIEYSVFVKTITQGNDVAHHWPLFILSLVQIFVTSFSFLFPCPDQWHHPFLFWSFCTDHIGLICSKAMEFISCFYEINKLNLLPCLSLRFLVMCIFLIKVCSATLHHKPHICQLAINSSACQNKNGLSDFLQNLYSSSH